MAFERAFGFKIGPTGAVETWTREGGRPAMLPAKQGVRGREKDRPARLEADDLKELASGPEFLPITIASRGSDDLRPHERAARFGTRLPQPADERIKQQRACSEAGHDSRHQEPDPRTRLARSGAAKAERPRRWPRRGRSRRGGYLAPRR